jgi:hypothetical protein
MFDSSGTLIWTRQFGSTANDWPNGMSLDAAGHIYVAGSTDGTLPGQTSVGGKDAFLRQYDNAGNVIWTRQFGTTANDWAGGVCVDAAGHVYVADSTLGTLPGQTNAGAIDAMVSQFDSAGTLVWARQFGAAEDDWALGVTVDSAGHLFVTGWTFGTLPGQTSAGGIDAFVRQYDSTGNEIWTRQFGSFDDDYAWGISRDSSNHLYVTGWTFGTLPGQTCAWEIDAFVRQYDSDGNEVWTHQFGTAENDWAMGAQVDSSGSVIVAGHTEGTMPGQTSAGKVDVFLLKTPATVSSSALVADFPGAGLWLYSANSWQQLSPYSSEMAVVTNDGNVVADYGVSGLWRWTTAGWQQLTSANPQNLVVDVNGAVVAGFGAAGLWRWTAGGGWQQLTSANAQELAVDGNGAVTADFGAAGLWRWTTASWQQLTFVDAQGIAVDFWGAVTADLGAYGLWRWATGVWQQLTYVDPQSIALDAWGAVTANLVGNGLWRWTSVGWELLTSVDAQGIAVDAWGAVTADLGIYGLWRWTTLGWEQLTSSDPVSIAVDGSETLLATFANAGIWRYSDKEGWVQITSANPYYTAVN